MSLPDVVGPEPGTAGRPPLARPGGAWRGRGAGGPGGQQAACRDTVMVNQQEEGERKIERKDGQKSTREPEEKGE